MQKEASHCIKPVVVSFRGIARRRAFWLLLFGGCITLGFVCSRYSPPQLPETRKDPTLFCFSVSVYPLLPTTELLAASLREACDEFVIFSTHTSHPHLNVVVGWTQLEWERAWLRGMDVPMQFVWRYLQQRETFDWVIKLDTDTWVRPSTFRKIFRGRSSREATILSTGGTINLAQGMHQISWGTGTPVDGFFVAVSRAAADQIVPALLNGDKCAAHMLSGHNEEAEDPKPCEVNFDVTLMWPVDSDGYAFLSPADGIPSALVLNSLSKFGRPWCDPDSKVRNDANPHDWSGVLAAHKAEDDQCDRLLDNGCGAQNNKKDIECRRAFKDCDAREKLGIVISPRGNHCLSKHMAVMHAVRSVEMYKNLTDAIAHDKNV